MMESRSWRSFLNLAPLAGRGVGHLWRPSLERTPKQSFGYGNAPGEGDSPRAQSVDRAPHPSPLPVRTGRGSLPSSMFDLRQLEQAHAVVGRAMPPTPAHAWPLLSQRLGAAVG